MGRSGGGGGAGTSALAAELVAVFRVHGVDLSDDVLGPHCTNFIKYMREVEVRAAAREASQPCLARKLGGRSCVKGGVGVCVCVCVCVCVYLE